MISIFDLNYFFLSFKIRSISLISSEEPNKTNNQFQMLNTLQIQFISHKYTIYTPTWTNKNLNLHLGKRLCFYFPQLSDGRVHIFNFITGPSSRLIFMIHDILTTGFNINSRPTVACQRLRLLSDISFSFLSCETWHDGHNSPPIINDNPYFLTDVNTKVISWTGGTVFIWHHPLGSSGGMSVLV